MATAMHAVGLGSSLSLLHFILNTISWKHLREGNKGIVLSVVEQKSDNHRSLQEEINQKKITGRRGQVLVY